MFIKLLNDELCKNNIFIKMIGIKAHDVKSAVKLVKKCYKVDIEEEKEILLVVQVLEKLSNKKTLSKVPFKR